MCLDRLFYAHFIRSWDDLVIGAPVYSERGLEELGKVYIYYNLKVSEHTHTRTMHYMSELHVLTLTLNLTPVNLNTVHPQLSEHLRAKNCSDK